jgi:peroxiredoxin
MSLRPIINVSLVALFCSAIIYSMAVQSGHADVPIAESANLIEPLVAGDNAPRFIVETANGDEFDFDPSKLDRPAVLLTFRGGWCPFCNMYLSEMRHVIPEMRKMGVDVLFLSGDRPEMLFESLSQETQEDIDGLDYTILSDANAQAAIALGIAFRASERTLNWLSDKDIADSSMMKHGVLPVPAVFAIDSDGVIQFAFTNADYKVRLPADELMAAAREIAAAN